MSKRRWALVAFGCILIAAGFYLSGACRDAFPDAEVARLAEVLDVKPGATVAEIGAGEGRMTVRMARIVGPAGHVFSTELNEARLRDIQKAVGEARLTNVTTIRGGERQTNLPPACCEAIFLSKVYHHFEDPAAMDTDMLRGLRPGGRLAVIDFAPAWWRFWAWGGPKIRNGHGVTREAVVRELTAAGFHLERIIDDWWSWPETRFCVVVRSARTSPPHP